VGFFLILCLHSISGQNCGNWTSPAGVLYDLSGLTKTSPPDYSATQSDNDYYTYYWNFCAPAFYVNPFTSCGGFKGATNVQLSYYSFCAPNGNVDNQVISETADGVQIVYKNGIDDYFLCDDVIARATYHLISCDPSTDYSVEEITEPSMCEYVVKARSKHACPVTEKRTCGIWVSPWRKQYDLHGLTNATGDYTGQDANGYKYYWNYCTNSLQSAKCKNGPAVAVLVTEDSCTALGYLNNVVWSESVSGLTVEYVNNQNDRCGANSFRSVRHSLVCDPRTQFELVSINTAECKTEITVRTKSACSLS